MAEDKSQPITNEHVVAALERGDYEAAARLARPLAEAGNSDAQCSMALLCEHGLGVPRDVEEAERWLVRAADQNNPVAWNNLGSLYSGIGRTEDAHRCYERAHALGFHAAAPYPPRQ
jgi:TPR repeat protein